MKSAQSTKVICSMECVTEKGNFTTKKAVIMMVNGETTKCMDLVLFTIRMEP